MSDDEAILLVKVRRDIEHVSENLDKRQYSNAAAWAASMVPDLLRLFGIVRREPSGDDS